MNSIALPAAGTLSPVVGAEHDLLRPAAAGSVEAFGELFRRHWEPAWRLAQAVAPRRDAAVDALAVGFTAALRAQRHLSARGPHMDETGFVSVGWFGTGGGPAAAARAAGRSGNFRIALLSSVYSAAMGLVPADLIDDAATEAVHAGQERHPGSPTRQLAAHDAAFRSMPERLRAAAWLGMAEGMEAERIATVLMVPVVVASELVLRARRGFAGRIAQAGVPVPTDLGEALRRLVLVAPANLPELAESSWLESVRDRRGFTALNSWLADHAVKPLSVAVAAMLGIGLVALPIVGHGGPLQSGVRTLAGGASNPVEITGPGCPYPCGAQTIGSAGSGLSFTTAAAAAAEARNAVVRSARGTTTLSPSVAGTGGRGAASSAGALPAGGGGAGSTSTRGPTAQGSTSSPTPGHGSGTGPGPGPGTPTNPPGGTTTVTLPGGAGSVSRTRTRNSVQVTVSDPVAPVTVTVGGCPTLAGVSVAGVSAGCSGTGEKSSKLTDPASKPVSTVSGAGSSATSSAAAVTSAANKAAKTVTGAVTVATSVTTLAGGL